ncbi:hypothetical protein Tco_0772251 [Tanacetum coccineum]|uniref:Uncharacterized protein n=1 Tax=Tanacetum coccineum TaxID=301880 RepID=A0ABQ4ZIA0_9ASTR
MENEDDRVKKSQIVNARARNIKGVPQKAEIAAMNLNSTINADCNNALTSGHSDTTNAFCTDLPFTSFNKEDVPFALDNIQAPSTRVTNPEHDHSTVLTSTAWYIWQYIFVDSRSKLTTSRNGTEPGASIRRHTGSYYPKRYWELLPKEILGAITQRDTGMSYGKMEVT